MLLTLQGDSRKKIFGGKGPGPSSFGRQQRLSEITIEPIKNFGGLGKIGGRPPVPGLKPSLVSDTDRDFVAPIGF